MQGTICDRCGKPAKNQDTVITLSIDMNEWDVKNEIAEPTNRIACGEMDLCEDCAPMVLKHLKENIMVAASRPGAIEFFGEELLTPSSPATPKQKPAREYRDPDDEADLPASEE